MMIVKRKKKNFDNLVYFIYVEEWQIKLLKYLY